MRCARPRSGRYSLRVGLAVVVLAVSGGCGGASPSAVDESLVYATVIREVVPVPGGADEFDGELFVWGSADEPLPLSVQAGTLAELDDYPRVRFVDAREEAIDEDDPAAPVRNDGVLVTLGEIVRRGRRVVVDVGRYRDRTDSQTVTVVLEERAGMWQVVRAQER